MTENVFDVIVVGAGHAGVEAALACARLGQRTLMLTLSMESIAFMACNPAIGGTAKGHLVREVDAMGGQMGIAADACSLQMKMLNSGKGRAVQSLRSQADKNTYHRIMKHTLEAQKSLTLMQAEVQQLIVENGRVKGVRDQYNRTFYAGAVILATGVYLNSRIIIGDYTKSAGPAGFENSLEFSSSIARHLPIVRFKTGTPARVNRNSIDFSQMEPQKGDCDIYGFSFLTDELVTANQDCYLAYTNQKTHDIIRANLDKSPLFNGSIQGIGPRYCPSIEDKVVRFADKERHQIFIEPEGADTDEMYVQGMSSSLPHSVQTEMYRSIKGMERVEIMRFAYAIEYDCIDPLSLLPTLESIAVKGLFTAGQINGSSGYEEAAAQGLLAGINAAQYLNGKEQLVLSRSEAYAGVLIDDLVTKGTNEPYRMMTARAEYRLMLRQENADLRLTQKGRDIGLVSDERYERYLTKKRQLEEIRTLLAEKAPLQQVNEILVERGENSLQKGIDFKEALRHNGFTFSDLARFALFSKYPARFLAEAETEVKYEGYLSKQNAAIAEQKRLEEKTIPQDVDFLSMDGLRLEARQKLQKVRPLNIAQASRISGVSPADITVLLVCLQRRGK